MIMNRATATIAIIQIIVQGRIMNPVPAYHRRLTGLRGLNLIVKKIKSTQGGWYMLYQKQLTDERERMRLRLTLAAAALAAVLAAPSALAWSKGEEGRQVKTRGAGLLTCEGFVKDKDARGEYTAWLDGYLSAYSQYVENTWVVDSKETGVLAWWLERYCERFPKEQFGNAVIKMLFELRPGSRPHA